MSVVAANRNARVIHHTFTWRMANLGCFSDVSSLQSPRLKPRTEKTTMVRLTAFKVALTLDYNYLRDDFMIGYIYNIDLNII